MLLVVAQRLAVIEAQLHHRRTVQAMSYWYNGERSLRTKFPGSAKGHDELFLVVLVGPRHHEELEKNIIERNLRTSSGQRDSNCPRHTAHIA